MKYLSHAPPPRPATPRSKSENKIKIHQNLSVVVFSLFHNSSTKYIQPLSNHSTRTNLGPKDKYLPYFFPVFMFALIGKFTLSLPPIEKTLPPLHLLLYKWVVFTIKGAGLLSKQISLC